jgi:hypothetical protein
MASPSSLIRVVASTPSAFDSALKEHAAAMKAAGGKLFVLFTGAKENGVSWCPDCNDASPILDSVLSSSASTVPTTLLEVPLVRSEYKGNADHWARKHASAKLQRIPTLMRWGNKGKTGELIEDGCKDKALVEELVLE